MCYFKKLKLCFTDKAIAAEYKIEISGFLNDQKAENIFHTRKSLIHRQR